MEAFLRQWRQDALDRHQYDSAIFIGDKLLAITREYIVHEQTDCQLKYHREGIGRLLARPSTLLKWKLYSRAKLPRKAQSHLRQPSMQIPLGPLLYKAE